MADEIKYCKDCLYFALNTEQKGLNAFKYAKCKKTSKWALENGSPLFGESFIHPDLDENLFCSTVRASGIETLCGPTGKFFAAIPPAEAAPNAPDDMQQFGGQETGH